MSSTDEDVLLRLHSITGVGTLVRPTAAGARKRGHLKPRYAWQVARRDHVIELLTALLPLMGQRRQVAIRKCLAA